MAVLKRRSRLSAHGSLLGLAFAVLTGCASEKPPADPGREYGASPTLVEPNAGLLPTVNPAKAIGWGDDQQPSAAAGMKVNAFARNLDHPRWLLVLPNGDVLVAESNSPASEGGFSGIKGWIAEKMMAYAGAGGASPDRITLLRDTDSDGVADIQTVFLSNLRSPFGMALVDAQLYVANADALMRYTYTEGATELSHAGEQVAPLPGGPLNHHWTKNVIASATGDVLYVAVGSNSNIGENGMEAEHHRAAILAIDPMTGATTVFADGLRNPVGMAWEPQTGALWTVVNERDELGDQLVPDYLTQVEQGAFYGWPYSYWGQTVDLRVTPQRPERVAMARLPDYALGAHTASLGLAFYSHDALSALSGAAIIGQHGSWNRANPSGYKVVAVPFTAGQPTGEPMDVLTGFLNAKGQAQGRPVGVAIDKHGAILVADDAGNAIWRVTAVTGS